LIALNRPDQCFGCANPAAAPHRSRPPGGQAKTRRPAWAAEWLGDDPALCSPARRSRSVILPGHPRRALPPFGAASWSSWSPDHVSHNRVICLP